jgi:pilus assembly protein CpaB
MRRGRIFIFLALIIILGLVAVFFVQQRFFAPAPSSPDAVEGQPAPEQVVDMAEVLVVVQNIPRGSLITEEHLGTMELPRENVLETMFLEDQMEAVVGRQARHDIDSGTPLTAGMLIDIGESFSDTGSIASLSIPKGMVAIPVPVDRQSSVAYALRPGDHVSVIASFMVIDVDTEFQSRLPNSSGPVISTGSPGENQPSLLTIEVQADEYGPPVGRTELDPLLNELIYVVPSEPQRARLVTQILMQDATVLRFGEFSWDDLRPEEAPAAAEGEDVTAPEQAAPQDEVTQPEETPPDVVTLIVTPQEAVALEHLRKSNVQFTLVLRASGDTDPIDTEGVTFQYLLETYNIPIPAKLPYGLEPRFDNAPIPTEPVEEQ